MGRRVAGSPGWARLAPAGRGAPLPLRLRRRGLQGGAELAPDAAQAIGQRQPADPDGDGVHVLQRAAHLGAEHVVDGVHAEALGAK